MLNFERRLKGVCVAFMTMMEKDKIFYKKMLLIGIPVVFQNLISIGLNLLDTLMIGMLGEEELAAVGAANQVYFIFTVSLFGLYSGAAVYTAQFWGARDMTGIRRMLGIDYLVGFVLAISVSIAAYCFAPQIIGCFSEDSSVIGFGTDYIRIACFSYVFSGISQAISYNARAIQNLKVPTIINAAALCINGVLNYLLIFGVGGFPQMGVKGAALATLIARILEMTALITFVYSSKEHPFKTKFSVLFSFQREHFVRVMRTAVPVLFTEGGWALSVSLVFAAYGHIGTAALAVAQVASVVCDMLQSVYFGVGNATAMIIGETLGTGDKEKAYDYGRRSMHIVWILNVVMTILLILLSKPIAGIYHFNAGTQILLVQALVVMALTITTKMLGYMYIVGIFRAGGDTVFCMKLELFCNLVVQISAVYFAVYVMHFGLLAAMIMGEAGSVVRIFASIPRFKSKKWINIMEEFK